MRTGPPRGCAFPASRSFQFLPITIFSTVFTDKFYLRIVKNLRCSFITFTDRRTASPFIYTRYNRLQRKQRFHATMPLYNERIHIELEKTSTQRRQYNIKYREQHAASVLVQLWDTSAAQAIFPPGRIPTKHNEITFRITVQFFNV